MSAICVILFLPWYTAARATPLLFPHRLEPIIFETGYLNPCKHIYHFAHLAECGMQYSMTFLASLVLFIYKYPNLGMIITGGLLAQFFHAWQDFKLIRTYPLVMTTDRWFTFWRLAHGSLEILSTSKRLRINTIFLLRCWRIRNLMFLLRGIRMRSETCSSCLSTFFLLFMSWR